MSTVDKPRFVLVTGDEATALTAGGKYRDHLPTWQRWGDQVVLLLDEVGRAWREKHCGNTR